MKYGLENMQQSSLVLLGMIYLSCSSVEVCTGGMHFPSPNSHAGVRTGQEASDMAACNITELGKGEIVGKKH